MDNNNRAAQYSSLSLAEVVGLCIGPCDELAWEEFVRRVRKAVSLTILRAASLWGEPSRSVVEDLVQLTYLKLWEDDCRILRDFVMQNPDGILGYLKKVATNLTHDHFRHSRSQSTGGSEAHVSTSDLDVTAGEQGQGSEDRIAFQILLNEIDEHLKQQLSGPDRERDRTIFWLYFQQGLSAKEIGSLPTIGLGAKGVGSVIERLKRCIRERIIANASESDEDTEKPKSNKPHRYVIGMYGSPKYGAST